MINYRCLTTKTNLKALHIFHCFFTTSSVKLFVVNFCLQLCFSQKRKTTLTKPFTFWKWKHISENNHTLKVKAHSKTNFENESMFYYLQWAFYLTQLICNFCCLTDTNNSIISIWLFLLVYTIHTIRWPESMELFTAIFHSYNWSKVSIGYRAPTFDEFNAKEKTNRL